MFIFVTAVSASANTDDMAVKIGCFLIMLPPGSLIAYALMREPKQPLVTFVTEQIGDVSRLREQYHELLYAVAGKCDGETRHETALRYIMERENRIEGPACEAGVNRNRKTRNKGKNS